MLSPLCLLVCLLCSVTGCLSLFVCSGCCGKGEGCISAGEITDSGELPAGDNKRGVQLVGQQFARVFGGLALAVGAAFSPDGTESGGVAAAFRSEVSATPRQR